MNVWMQLLASRKVRVALVAVAMNVLAVCGANTESARTLVESISVLAGLVIAAIAHEDATKTKAQATVLGRPSATTDVTVNNNNAGDEPGKA